MNIDFLCIKDNHIFGVLNVCDKSNMFKVRIVKFWGDPKGRISIRAENTTDFAIISAIETRENLDYNFDIDLDILSPDNYKRLEQKYIIDKMRL